MTNAVEYFKQSELALAAYSLLTTGIQGDPYISALEQAGMATKQAENFARDWRVIDQFTDPTGVSATIFEKGGQRYVAVRGTELSVGDILADGVLALGVPAKLNQQYIALKAKMEEWRGDPAKLGGQTYTVSGHSLGGYLAAALKRTYPATEITAAYLYNAPGTGGLIGNLADLLSGIFTDSVPGADGIWNIKGSEGASFITGLGSQASPGIPVHIEQDTNIGFGNHSVVRLTDALAIHALYARVFPDLNLNNRNTLFDASGRITEETLEAALDALRKLILGPDIAATLNDEFTAGKPETRDRLFTHLYELQKSSAFTALGSLSATLLTGSGAAQLLEMANANTPEGQAVRYAMENLNPFFVPGGSYAAHNAQGELDLFDPQTGQGAQTLEYLKDRAALLERKMWFSSQEKNPVNPQMQSGGHLFENEVAYYEDVGNRYKIAQGTINDATPRFLFGSDKSDVLKGKEGNDHLYGMAGLDLLEGGKGNDYLEGGQNLDFYRFRKGDGTDTLLDTDRRALLQRNNDLLVLAFKDGDVWKGGSGQNAFIATQSGNDLILSFTDNPEDRITLKNFDFDAAKTGQGSHGLHLIDPLPAAANPVRSYLGDTQDWDSDPATNGIQRVADGRGNYLRADDQDGRPLIEQTNRADTFLGSTGPETERFTTGDGNDVIYADGPDSLTSPGGGIDLIDTGKGRDIVAGGGNHDRIQGGEGGDILGGNAGNDLIHADTDNNGALTLEAAIQAGDTALAETGETDLVSGDSGNDTLIGSARSDALIGGDDKDILIGGGGDDNLFGDGKLIGATYNWKLSRDEIAKEGGSPEFAEYSKTYLPRFIDANVQLDPAAGSADLLIAGAGDDWAFGGAGDDLIQGGKGQDILFGEAGSDVLQGGDDDDRLHGDNPGHVAAGLEGDDILDGGAGKDYLQGDGGNDVLIGGAGNDILAGGAGKDIYLFNKGDGVDTIIDTADDDKGAEASVLLLGKGFKREDIKFSIGSLYVDVGGGEGLHFENFDRLHPEDTPVIGEIRFADGDVMSYADILAQGFDIDGTDGDDDGHDAEHHQLLGTSVNDRIRGLAGNDRLVAYGGNDTLDGGQGADVMYGGEGNDTYVFNNGDGQAGTDLILDGQGNDVAVFNGVSLSQITLSHTSGGLNLQYSSTDTVSIADGLLGGIKTYQFADGTLSWHELANRYLDTSVYANYGTPIHGLAGGRQNDTLTALGGGTTFAGGQGNDTLTSAGGNNVFLYGRGDGSDRIVDLRTTADGAGPNTLKFGEGISREELSASVEDGVLLLRLGTAGDAIRIENFDLANPLSGPGIDRFEFADGVVVTRKESLSAGLVINGSLGWSSTLVGGNGNDILNGGFANDDLSGGAGVDRLSGGEGYDIYRVGADEDSVDLIVDPDPLADNVYSGGVDRVVFAPGVSSGEIRVSGGRDAGFLELTRPDGAGVRIQIGARGLPDVEFVEFQEDGVTLDTRSLMAIAENDTVTGTEADEIINTGYGNDTIAAGGGNDVVYGGFGDDVIAGEAGDDLLVGGAGNDTFVFRLGDGHDTIDQANTYDLDVIRFGPGIRSSDITITREDYIGIGYDRVFHIAGTEDSLRLKNWAGLPSVVFADGETWTSEFLRDLFVRQAAGEAADQVRGTAGDDRLFGLGGNDELIGEAGNDVLDGGAGDDLLLGEAGNDTYLFGRGSGIDVVRQWGSGAADVDVIWLGEGVSTQDVSLDRSVDGIGLSLRINGTSDRLDFAWWNLNERRVSGIRFADGTFWDAAFIDQHVAAFERTVFGTDDADLVQGGNGNDYLLGHGGSDVYVFDRGDGWDRVSQDSANAADVDTLRFGSGIAAADLSAARVGNDLYLSIAGGSDTVSLLGWWDVDVHRVSRFEFADGSVWSADAITALYEAPIPDPDPVAGVVGTAGDDDLSGTGTAESMSGGEGNDTYHFGRGSGQDAVSQFLAGAADLDVIRIGAGVVVGDLSVTETDAGLRLGIAGTADTLTLEGWWDASVRRVSRLVFEDETSLTADELSAMARPLPPDPLAGLQPTVLDGSGDGFVTGTDDSDVIDGGAGDDWVMGLDGNDIMTGGSGSDYLFGGSGDDLLTAGEGEGGVLAGGLGSDTYILNRGDGGVAIDQRIGDGSPNEGYAGTGGADVVRFGAGILASDIVVSRNDNVLALSVAGTGDAIYVWGWWDPAFRRVERFEFSDGRSWTGAQVDALAAGQPLGDVMQAGSGEVVEGTGGSDLILGYTGANTLNGNGGNDIVQGGGSDDFLAGQAGNDLLTGAEGDDALSTGDGSDLVIGGNGNDAIHLSGDCNIVVFNDGDGVDTISSDDWSGNTVSLGGGIEYNDLVFRKNSDDLVLDTGGGEGMAFKDWYASPAKHTVLNLQIVAEAMSGFDTASENSLLNGKVRSFDFRALADAFDAARTANPGLTSWALTDALTQFQLAGSDSAALGGDLAYQYGKNGTVAGIGLTAAQQVIGDANFGSQAQTLRPLAGLQEGAVRLS